MTKRCEEFIDTNLHLLLKGDLFSGFIKFLQICLLLFFFFKVVIFVAFLVIC